MPRLALSALAAAAILVCATPRAPAASAALLTPLPTHTVHLAAIVCGGVGCNPVQTKSLKRRKFKPLGYTKPI